MTDAQVAVRRPDLIGVADETIAIVGLAMVRLHECATLGIDIVRDASDRSLPNSA